jgi:hypothetical protein
MNFGDSLLYSIFGENSVKPYRRTPCPPASGRRLMRLGSAAGCHMSHVTVAPEESGIKHLVFSLLVEGRLGGL